MFKATRGRDTNLVPHTGTTSSNAHPEQAIFMNEQHPYRATIAPVPQDTPRPLLSVMIPTYNCAGYLRETLASVLSQDPGPEIMQIEVIDDRSTQDDPAYKFASLKQKTLSKRETTTRSQRYYCKSIIFLT